MRPADLLLAQKPPGSVGTPRAETSPKEKGKERFVVKKDSVYLWECVPQQSFIPGEEELYLAELYLHQDVRIPSSSTSRPS